VGANFGKCHLDLPPADEPCENVAGASIEVGGEESLRLELACRIANEKPTDRHWRRAAVIPDGGAAGDFDEAVGSAVPETDAAALPGDTILHLAETLPLKVDDALRAAIAEVQQLAASAHAAPFAATQAARVVVAQRPDAEILALWLADAVLAARLKWPLPLIAGALVHPSLRSGGHQPYPGDASWTLTCCVAYGHAAAQACDLFAALGRSSQKLIAVAPRLRARGAAAP
jgi:hypothetical protein